MPEAASDFDDDDDDQDDFWTRNGFGDEISQKTKPTEKLE